MKILDNYNNWNQEIVILSLMMLFAIIFVMFLQKFMISTIKHFVHKFNPTYVNILEQYNFFRYLLHSCFALYLLFWSNLFRLSGIFSPFFYNIQKIALAIYSTIAIALLLIAINNIASRIYATNAVVKRIPIRLHAQILKIFISICAVVIIISYAFNISLISLATSLGATTALLTFVFKDTVLGLLASLQLTFQDIVQVGDWISVPQYNVLGEVLEITITVVKIKNPDQTTSTIPTSTLLATNVINWRNVYEVGGRRLQTSIYIDINTIMFCSQELLTHLQQVYLVSDDSFRANGADGKITNITLFRLYAHRYLTNHQQIHQKEFNFIVRELDPAPTGLPIEIYIFTKEVEWSKYENIKAEIIDHLISILPEFKLKVFQYHTASQLCAPQLLK